MIAVTRGSGDRAGCPADLPRGGAGGRQDVRHAERGPAAARARRRRRRRRRRDARAARTAEQIGDLEVVPRRRSSTAARARRRWTSTAILAGGPSSSSSTSSPTPTRPARRNAKRWQDVDELLAAGIDVISTVNIQHLESLNDVVERITGIRQRETIPDHVVRAADQIELVDMAPEALRRRLAHGNVYARREDRRRARQLLPPRQPRRAARARAAVGGRPRRRRAAGLPRAPRHHPTVGDARAGRRRPRRCARQRPPRAPGGAHRPARQGRPDRRARRRRLRARPADEPTATSRRRSGACSRSSAASTAGSPATTSPRRSSTLARSENATQIVLGASGRSRWHELFQRVGHQPRRAAVAGRSTST